MSSQFKSRWVLSRHMLCELVLTMHIFPLRFMRLAQNGSVLNVFLARITLGGCVGIVTFQCKEITRNLK